MSAEMPSEQDHAKAAGSGGHHSRHSHQGGHEEHHEGAPEWLISFADNVTLMMSFFVILLSITLMKTANTGTGSGPGQAGGNSFDMLDLVISLREAFHNPVNVHSTNPADFALVRRILERRGTGGSERTGELHKQSGTQTIRQEEAPAPGTTLRFDDDSSTLSAEAVASVHAVAEQYRGWRIVLEVGGHVSAKEAYHRKDRGMQLAFDRAHVVAEALVAGGIDWGQIWIMSYADNVRVHDLAYVEQAQQENARVEIVPTTRAMRTKASEALDAQEAPAESQGNGQF